MPKTLLVTAAILSSLIATTTAAPDVTVPGRWTVEKANDWHQQQPWLVGCNFTPSTAINQLEMWQADTFDPETIDRELGWAADIGMNTVRVYLHDLLWQQDSEGFLKRIDQFLAIADQHGIRTMLVLCDAVWNPHPKLGKQPDPKPHLHNSGWVQSPHIEVLRDPAKHDSLEPYCKGVLGRFKDDERVLVWDLYNEPGNDGEEDKMTTAQKEEKCLLLLRKMFTWAREVNPSQPLTAGLWSNEWVGPKVTAQNLFMRENSDVISFHVYDRIEKTAERVGSLEPLGRPLLCTEYLARGNGSRFEEHLPYFKKNKIGAYNWGFVAGKIQTQYPWASWRRKFTAEPKVWHHDLLKPDGTPHIPSEVELIKSLTSTKKTIAQLQEDFRKLEFGMFIHYNMATYKNTQWVAGYHSPADLDPGGRIDTDAWADAAVSAGMTYGVLTVKHVAGFCLWDSKHTTYDVMHPDCPYQQDLVAQFIKSFQSRGLKVGLYYCWRHPGFKEDYKVLPPECDPAKHDLEAQIEFQKKQIAELIGKYPEVFYIWNDALDDKIMTREEANKFVRGLGPDILASSNWWDWGRKGTPFIDIAVKEVRHFPETNTAPGETCWKLEQGWFWNEGARSGNAKGALGNMTKAHARNSNFLLNVGPDKQGRIIESSVKTLAEIGKLWKPQE